MTRVRYLATRGVEEQMRMMSCALGAVLGLALLSQEARAQETSAGQTVTSSVGRVGQRQQRGSTASAGEPLVRIDTRINSRVSLRLNTRIDRNSVVQNGTSAYTAANDQARVAGRRQRR